MLLIVNLSNDQVYVCSYDMAETYAGWDLHEPGKFIDWVARINLV